jgi:hypothetical protein
MAEAIISVDVTEAKQKLDEVEAQIKRIYALIDKSWLLRLLFFGFRKAGAG